MRPGQLAPGGPVRWGRAASPLEAGEKAMSAWAGGSLGKGFPGDVLGGRKDALPIGDMETKAPRQGMSVGNL